MAERGPAPGRRAVLFDAAGTLIELREGVGETYARFAREHGAAIPAWRLEDAFRRIWAREPVVGECTGPADAAAAREREAWRRLVRQTFLAADSAVRPTDFEGCFDALWAHYGSARAWRARPDAAETLDRLRAAGVATAVVSNFDHRLPAILRDLGLAGRLDRVLRPLDAGAAKPDPRIFGAALHRLGVAARDALFVGDDAARDLEGARRAGLRAVDVASLATLLDLTAGHADGDRPEHGGR